MSLHVTIVTPLGTVANKTVDQVVAPGTLGELGILPGHLPLLTAIVPGVAVLITGSERETFAVGQGYMQVGAGDDVKLLVNVAQAAGKIEGDAARAELAEATRRLKEGLPEGDDRGAVEFDAAWARARLLAAARAGKGAF